MAVVGPGVVDAHMHIWDVPRPGRQYHWTPDPHPVELLLPEMDAAGVVAALQVTPTIMDYDNGYGLAVAAEQPGRFGVFGRFDADLPDVEGRLAAFAAEPGAVGIRMTFFGATGAGEGDLLAHARVWEACEALDVPVAVLAPDALTELAAVAERHPRLRLIVDHLGLGVYEGSPDPYLGWPELPALAAQENVTVKISTLIETSREPYPFRDVHDRLAEAVELFGVERLMWGSNYPVVLSACGYAESLRFLESCSFLDAEDLEWLTSRSLREVAGWPTDHGSVPEAAFRASDGDIEA